MTERLLAALTDNGKWLEGFTRLGYESTFREYCNRFTPDYLAAVREAGESGLPALADSLLDALEAQWKQARWPKDVYHAAGYERICKGFKLRILGFEVPEKKKEAPLDDEI